MPRQESQPDMRTWLADRLHNVKWGQGVSKDDLVRAVQDDDALRNVLGQYVAEGTYRSLDEVCNVLPEQAWQDAQGDRWRGGESYDMADMPSNFQDGPVGQDQTDVYHRGAAPPPTPGFGETAATEDDRGQTG